MSIPSVVIYYNILCVYTTADTTYTAYANTRTWSFYRAPATTTRIHFGDGCRRRGGGGGSRVSRVGGRHGRHENVFYMIYSGRNRFENISEVYFLFFSSVRFHRLRIIHRLFRSSKRTIENGNKKKKK